MNRLLVLFVSLAAIVTALMACAGSIGQQHTLEQKLAKKNYRMGEPVERIQQWRVDSWAYVDRRHLIMQTAPSTYYLVSLKNTCHGLGTAENIAFTTTTSQLTHFDKLLVRGSGGLKEQCYITALHKLEKVQKGPSS